MKVTLLGTSAAEGLPALFCRCATCYRARELGGKNIRTRSSALIDGVVKIDFPPDMLCQVIRTGVDLSRIQALLFTHGHDDHFSPGELQYRGRYFVSSPLNNPLPIYAPSDVIDRLRAELDTNLVDFSLHTVEPERPLTIANYEVFPFMANHDHSRICLNYILRDPNGVTLLYASDTGWYPPATWRLLEAFQLDAVVVECAKRDEGGYPGHLSIPEVLLLRERLIAMGVLQTDTMVLATHFCHLMNLLHEELEAILSTHGIRTAYDGITFEVTPRADAKC